VGKTRYGIAVPGYMRGVRCITDLDHSETGRITGIQPGAVLMERIETDIIPRYHLHPSLVEASTLAMLAELDQAYRVQESIVFLAWSPHWMNQEYDSNYLSGPKNATGSVDAAQTIHSVIQEGLAGEEPAAYALIKAMRLDEDQVRSLEISINNAGDPQTSVRRWLKEKKNRELVRPWVEAVKNAQEA